MPARWALGVWLGLFGVSPALAHSVRSDLDLKFYAITSYTKPPEYLGFTSSKVDNFVSVPFGDTWYVRPDGRLNEDDYARLVQELKTKHFPGLDLSDRWDVNNKNLAQLDGLSSLRILRFTNTKMTDGGLDVLAGLSGLKVLNVNNQISDAGLRRMRGLQHLEALDLHRSKVTNAGLAVLKELPRLEMLDLSGTRVTDAGMKHIAAVTTLKQLDISGTAVTDAGMILLADLPHLETLYVSSHLTNHGLKAIARLKHLRNLDLSSSHITDEGMETLASLPHLEALALSDTRVSNAVLASVARLKSLKTLELSDTGVTRDGLSQLSGMPHLETLSLAWPELSNSELESLSGLPHLSRVILNGRTLAPEVLDRIRTMAKFAKPQPVQTATLGEHHAVPGVAPTSHPVHVSAPAVAMKTNIPAPQLRPGGDVVRPGAPLPPDLAASPSEKRPIALDDSLKGKGMIIEVGAASASGSGHHLTGLKRIYQAEVLQGSHDPDLTPGESSQINFPKETAENSLGEINVNAGH